MSRGDGVAVEVRWAINPFRGDAFEKLWLPAAEAALDFGATYWALLRSQEGMLDFTQHAHFQVPLLPTFHTIAGSGALEPAAAGSPAQH